ncbi:hypothetical protein EV360DRAFT_72759 [Lentinula raphanica]|nr:hypothetical protein EV360DRAFT_72759 [Lentinula raphanica]
MRLPSSTLWASTLALCLLVRSIDGAPTRVDFQDNLPLPGLQNHGSSDPKKEPILPLMIRIGSDVKEEVPGRIAETGEEVCTWSLEEWGEPLAQDEKIKGSREVESVLPENLVPALEPPMVIGGSSPQYPERKELVFKEIPGQSKSAETRERLTDRF